MPTYQLLFLTQTRQIISNIGPEACIKILTGFIIVVASFLFGSEFAALLGGYPLMLFSLCAGGCSGCTGSCSGGGDGGPYSTPFLYAWDGQKYVMDNDVMFGKPRSHFPVLSVGKELYLAGEIIPDKYVLQKPLHVDQDGKVKLMIQEIEPEESLYDFVGITAITHPANLEPVVDCNYGTPIYFSKKSISESEKAGTEATVYRANTKLTETARICPSASKEQSTLRNGDVASFTFVADQAVDTYLIISSVYRDWHIDDVYPQQEAGVLTASPFTSRKSKLGKFMLAGTLSMLVGSFMSTNQDTPQDKSFMDSFGIKTAQADAVSTGNKSLLVTFSKDGTKSETVVIEPRYFAATKTAIKIPAEFIAADGQVNATVEATKNHQLLSAFPAVSETEALKNETTEEKFELSEVLTTTTADEPAVVKAKLSKKNNSEFVYAKFQDRIELEFTAPASYKHTLDKDMTRSFVFDFGGVYGPLPGGMPKVSATWLQSLDKDSQQLLDEMYQVNSNTVI